LPVPETAVHFGNKASTGEIAYEALAVSVPVAARACTDKVAGFAFGAIAISPENDPEAGDTLNAACPETVTEIAAPGANPDILT
jgi:hypothetical protein